MINAFALIRLLLLAVAAFISHVDGQYGAMQMPGGLSPRHYLAISPLEPRQASSGDCPDAYHSCRDIDSASCCPDTTFCFINATFVPSCCQIGSTCSYTACDTLHYQCLSTSTITGVPTTVAACCPRSCPSTSAYKCPDPSGGCCSFGSSCEGNACVSTVSTSKAVASEIPVGCTATTQIACPSSLGGGCCVNTESCTVVSNSNYCVAITGVATRTGSNGAVATLSPSTASNGLSTGAKAGIGAGIAVLALVLITALLWFYLIYRRNSTPSQPTPSQPTESERPIPPARQGTDYFGPIATAGPFTEDHATPPLGRPRNMSGVPISPNSPGDIAVPVEIDSRSHSNSTISGQRKGEGTAVEMAELP